MRAFSVPNRIKDFNTWSRSINYSLNNRFKDFAVQSRIINYTLKERFGQGDYTSPGKFDEGTFGIARFG